MALEVTEDKVGAADTRHPDVLGVVVDIPRDGSSASLVALADGTTSLYTRPGGGIIGAGGHASVREAQSRLLTMLQGQFEMFPPDERTNLPSVDYVQITVITPAGRRRALVPATIFWGQEPSTIADLVGAIQDVISALRETAPGQ